MVVGDDLQAEMNERPVFLDRSALWHVALMNADVGSARNAHVPILCGMPYTGVYLHGTGHTAVWVIVSSLAYDASNAMRKISSVVTLAEVWHWRRRRSAD